MKADKPVLVVYYSLTGNTARVAEDIAARLNAEVETISDQRKRSGLWGHLRAVTDTIREAPAQIANFRKDPTQYVLIVVGTPVWAAKMTPAIRAYLRITRGALGEVAFFTTSGNTDAAKIVPFMEALAGQKAIAFTGFNASDLKNATVYENKITAFVDILRRSSPARAAAIDDRLRAHG